MRLLSTASLLLLPLLALGQTKGKNFEYREGSTTLEGYIAKPANVEKAPVVLIVHDWNGIDDYEKRRADMVADLGYVGFAVDVYGKGVRPANNQESSAQAGKFRADRPLFRSRLQAAFEAAKAMPGVDPERIAIMGYCFGGGGALELARTGAALRGAASFHGSLDTPLPADPNTLKARILVMHGAEDRAIGPDAVAKFMDEMRAANADWQFITYSKAVHGFTEPSRPQAYNADADRRSWEHFTDFLREVFK